MTGKKLRTIISPAGRWSNNPGRKNPKDVYTMSTHHLGLSMGTLHNRFGFFMIQILPSFAYNLFG